MNKNYKINNGVINFKYLGKNHSLKKFDLFSINEVSEEDKFGKLLFKNQKILEIINKNYNIKELLGEGTIGSAYLLENGNVLKITKDIKEVNLAKKLFNKNLKHYVEIYNIKFIEIETKKIYFIEMEYVIPLSNEEKIFYVITEGYYRYSKSPQRKYDKNILNFKDFFLDELRRQGFPELKNKFEKYKKLYLQYIDMKNELRNYSYCDTHEDNVGWKKDGKLCGFDFELNDENQDLPDVPILESLNEKIEKDDYDYEYEEQCKKVKKYFGVTKLLGSGCNGTAYLTADNKVIKITEDDSEVVLALKIQKKDQEHYVKIYDAWKLPRIETYNQEYLILMEKITTLTKLQKEFFQSANELTNYPKPIFNIEKFKDAEYVTKKLLDSRLSEQYLKFCKNPNYFKFILQLKILKVSLEKFGVHDIHEENLGWKENGNLCGFDFETYKTWLSPNKQKKLKTFK